MYKVVKCSICKNTKENTNLPELVEEHKWQGTMRYINNHQMCLWYCPKHSIEAIINFER